MKISERLPYRQMCKPYRGSLQGNRDPAGRGPGGKRDSGDCRGRRDSRGFPQGLQYGEDVKLWGEFEQNLYTMKASLENGSEMSENFGMRDFDVDQETKQLVNNGDKVFLREEANCAVFPLTAYAPMDEAGWEKLFSTYQSYGINAVRFTAGARRTRLSGRRTAWACICSRSFPAGMREACLTERWKRITIPERQKPL